MSSVASPPGNAYCIDSTGLDRMIQLLRERGWHTLGPRRRDQAIVYDEVTGVRDLPKGWTDEQSGGHYRLQRRDDDALFGYAVGPHSWKSHLHPPALTLFRARRTDDGFTVETTEEDLPPTAFIGVRACELAAIAVQDKVLLDGPYVDPHYQSRRERTFIVAVNCGSPSGSCFCVSMETGPRAANGFDIALTEILNSDGHRFLLEVGSERGEQIVAELPSQPAADADHDAARAVTDGAAQRMGRAMNTDGIKELLQSNLEHRQWDVVAERCLACGNCTMVCPTCFCTTVTDVNDLSGKSAERVRQWDSCFTYDFSYIHGGSVRPSTKARYRQWLTHKLAHWHDQFDMSGCVGCGRCITWCPVGIDITEEVAAMRAEDE